MVKLRTLGECVAEIGPTRLGPDAERLFAVLLCLGIERDRLSSRGALMGLLWPDVPDGRGAHSLRQAVYRLRALGVPVRSDRSNLWIEPSALEIDCAPLLGAGPEPDGFVHQVRGSFLAGYHPKFSDRYGEWLDRQRDLVNARIRRSFLAEIGRLKAEGDWAGVECMAARCLAIDPLNEEATLAKAEAAALQGGKTQALAILDGYLKEVGPQAREIRLPATVLRRRIAEANNLERSRAITETPFFGRAVEMALLNRALQLAHGGTGTAHLFWGEPGIGKTRLMQEFSRALSLGHAQLVRVGCQSNDDRRPLSMFADMLPRLLGMPGALGCAPTAMRHLRRLTEHDPKEPFAPMDPRDAAMVYANIRRSLLDLLDAVAAESLLVLIIEDVHWLDAGSWDVIADALSWLGTRRVLLLLTAREPDAERKRGIGELPGLQRHHLPPLDRVAVDLLSTTIAERNGKALPPDVAEWCATSSGGNPYHLMELVLHGLREGTTTKLPASLSQLIAERLARLHPLSLHVLQGVSVLGAHSTLDRLERLLDQRRLDLVDALDELERSGLIESEPSRLVSKHELLSQAAVARLSVSARRLLHRHAARVLEGDAAASPAPAMQWACAEHWREAGDVGRALSYLQECARYA
ncbi:MAG TPA: AAA family ATPase, partial [Gemmatimonadaceae bacterium]|nr:AAA family ATPase [Gemmatimonadaceae bacterium]